jgi:predicted nucleic acid-binding protein
MTVIDANYFLRAIVRPQTPHDVQLATTAQTLFRLAAIGQETFTTNDAVIAEVVFILHSPRHYNLPRPDVSARLKPILSLSGCKLPQKTRVLRAFTLWEGTPSISFVDALTATQALDLGVALGSFDRRLGRVPGITLWQPPASPIGGPGTTNDPT